MHRAGVPLGITGTVGALLLLGLRFAQVYLPGRSAEVTDMVILLALTGLMELIPDEALR
jgi:VanZ family protein